MRWDTTSRRRGGSLLLNSINLVIITMALGPPKYDANKIQPPPQKKKKKTITKQFCLIVLICYVFSSDAREMYNACETLIFPFFFLHSMFWVYACPHLSLVLFLAM